MANTRPDILLTPDAENDIYAILNAQAGFPAVTVGAKLRIQNKSQHDIFIHQTDQAVTNTFGGTLVPFQFQSTTDDNILGCKATVSQFAALIQVEVLA